MAVVLLYFFWIPLLMGASEAASPDDFKPSILYAQSFDAKDDLSGMGLSFEQRAGVPKDPIQDALPAPETRDAFFTRAGLQAWVAHMDDLDKDLLYRKARAWSMERLQAAYPSAPLEKLNTLQSTLRKLSETGKAP